MTQLQLAKTATPVRSSATQPLRPRIDFFNSFCCMLGLILGLAIAAALSSGCTEEPAAHGASQLPPAAQPAPAKRVASPARKNAPAPEVASEVVLPDGTTVVAPKGSALRVERSTNQQDSGVADGGRTEMHGDDVKGVTAGTPSSISFPGTASGAGGASASSGGLNTNLSAVSNPATPMLLYGLGALLIVGAAAWLYLGKMVNWRGPAIMAGTGFVLIGCGVVAERYPWVYLIALVLVLVVIGYVFYSLVKTQRGTVAVKSAADAAVADLSDAKAAVEDQLAQHNKTLEVLVRSIEDLGKLETPDSFKEAGNTLTYAKAAEVLKRVIDYHTDSADDEVIKSTVSAVKRKAGIDRKAPVIDLT